MGDVANPMHITGIVSAQAARVDDAGLLAPQNAGLDVRTGVAWGPGTATLVTGNGDTAPMSVWVGTCNWFSSRGVANGPYRGAAESVRTVTLAAAPASGSRIDVVYVKALDNTAGVPSPDGSAGESYAAVTGTATTGTPVKPALPVGAEELATVTISAGATSTNGAGVVIANTSRQTVARGARIPVRTQADRDGLAAFKGLEVYRLDTGQVQLCTGTGPTAWATTYDPALPAIAASWHTTFNTSKMPPGTALVTLNLPSAGVAYRMSVQVIGQAGFDTAAQTLSWGFDSLPAQAINVTTDPVQPVNVAAAQWVSLVGGLHFEMPAGVATSFRVLLATGSSGSAYCRGGVYVQRSPIV